MSQAIEASDFVFRATINGVVVTNPASNSTRVRIFYTSLIPMKGGEPSFTELYTLDSGACGVEMLVPEDYWIFTDSEGFVSRCASPRLASSEETRFLEIGASEQILRNVARKTAAVPGVDADYSVKSVALISIISFGALLMGMVLGCRIKKKLQEHGHT